MSIEANDVEWVFNDKGQVGVKIGEQFFWFRDGRSTEHGGDEGHPATGYQVFGERDSITYRTWSGGVQTEYLGRMRATPDEGRWLPIKAPKGS